jgi:pilus assembly protein Flp/PilA
VNPALFNVLFNVLSVMLMRFRSEKGQTMAEYGILIAVIALVVVGAAMILGGGIQSAFSNASKSV